MFVQVVEMSDPKWTYEAKAWVDDKEIYSRTLTDMFWSAPLADMGRQEWELVSITTENALMGSWVKGWESATSRPVRTNFLFKRPA